MARAKWRKFTRQEIDQFVSESCSMASLADKLGYAKEGGSYLSAMKNMIQELNLDVSHFVGQNWAKNNFDYSRFQKGKVVKAAAAIGALTFLRGHKCECCGMEEWMTKPIPLEVHHKDGNSLNNEIENLMLLCPNCHALTENYRGKNINQGDKKVSDDKLAQALKDNPNIRQALKAVGLTAKGGNYQRARELIFTYSIEHLMSEHQEGKPLE
jgi:hypothetical protein